MNAPTPPSRKVAKPKSRQLRPSVTARPPIAAQEKQDVAPTPPTESAPAVTPQVAASPTQEKPAFIDSESAAPSQRPPKGRTRHKNPTREKSGTPTPSAPQEHRAQEDTAMGPQTRHLTLLGNKTIYSDRYTPAILEAFDNRHPENDYFVKFNCPEFTSLCPITGQPDFATIYISYIPDRKMVESKSLKLYLFGFRNHGAFHEDCVNLIMKDLIKLLSPRYIEVWGKFLPRGGLSIDPYANYGRPTTRWEEFARQRLLMHDLAPERVDNR